MEPRSVVSCFKATKMTFYCEGIMLRCKKEVWKGHYIFSCLDYNKAFLPAVTIKDMQKAFNQTKR